MRLLTKTDILEAINAPQGDLRIVNFRVENLQHTCYYVTLGDRLQRPVDDMNVVKEEWTSATNLFAGFAPNEFIHAESAELFWFGSTVWGLIGPLSDNYKRSIAFHGGQTIDPLFPDSSGRQGAPLTFGLKNLTNEYAALPRGAIVAKITFFDISDSTPFELSQESIIGRKFESARIHAHDAQLRVVQSKDDG